jgi:putative FmdB family regulatory protein
VEGLNKRMPIYEYRCAICKNQKDLVQNFKGQPPFCSCGNKMQRLVSKSSFILKGNGWEKDGYCNRASKSVK